MPTLLFTTYNTVQYAIHWTISSVVTLIQKMKNHWRLCIFFLSATAHSMLYVNNYGRFPLSSEIRNIGHRLDLGTMRSFSKKSVSYQADNGIRVTSTGSIYNGKGTSDDLYYAIGYLFDQSLGSSHTHFYRNSYGTATLTFDLKKVYFLNTVRVHVICTFPTKFRVSVKTILLCFKTIML